MAILQRWVSIAKIQNNGETAKLSHRKMILGQKKRGTPTNGIPLNSWIIINLVVENKMTHFKMGCCQLVAITPIYGI